ncbi:hypothetical protein LNP20_11455 [Klebsiella pneumoniae subsp. pneumoniae]|nr:hypothetical protein [Klebsiella pneumoniae subsp. pneumoniae]
MVYGERGPSAIKFDVAEDLDELIKAVLKKGNSGVRYAFSENYMKYFCGIVIDFYQIKVSQHHMFACLQKLKSYILLMKFVTSYHPN